MMVVPALLNYSRYRSPRTPQRGPFQVGMCLMDLIST